MALSQEQLNGFQPNLVHMLKSQMARTEKVLVGKAWILIVFLLCVSPIVNREISAASFTVRMSTASREDVF